MTLSMGRILSVAAMIVTIIAIVSSTLGREIMSGRQPGLWSFSTIHFAGYLFFLVMPVEALIPSANPITPPMQESKTASTRN